MVPVFGEKELPVYMGGGVMPSQDNTSVTAAHLTLSPGAPYKENKQPVTLTVDATFEVNGYKIQVQREVKTLNCL